MTVFIN